MNGVNDFLNEVFNIQYLLFIKNSHFTISIFINLSIYIVYVVKTVSNFIKSKLLLIS
jgi:hypothetical protein